MTPIFKKSADRTDSQGVGSFASAPARLAGSAVLALQSDERLVALARTGHERAFEAIVERYRKPLVRYCGRLLPASRAEDAVQQAFLSAHTAFDRGDDVADLKPWLYKIAHNSSLNMVRQNGWNHDQIPLDFDGVRRPDQVVEQREQLKATVAALNELPDRQRDAIVMREFEGRSYTEIAASLGAGDGAVRQLLNRARVTLRSAATALTPPPILLRIGEINPGGGGGGTRVAEVVGGLGAAGLAKAGATALVAGSLVVGAVNAPLPVNRHSGAVQEAVAKPPGNSPTGASIVSVADKGSGTGAGSPQQATGKRKAASRTPAGVRKGGKQPVAGGREHDGSEDRSGSDERSDDQPVSGDRGKQPERSGKGSDDDTVAAAPGAEPDDSGGSGKGSDDSVPEDTASAVSPEPPETKNASDDLPEPDPSGKSGSGRSGSGKSGSSEPEPPEDAEPATP
jgi:RNA polymerase sigma factor (sigma-70 family)